MRDRRPKILMNLALGDSEGGEKERASAAFKALKIIHEYDLLSGGKPVNVASSMLEKIMSLDIEDVATHAEKFASGFERIMGASKRVTGMSERRERPLRRRRR